MPNVFDPSIGPRRPNPSDYDRWSRTKDLDACIDECYEAADMQRPKENPRRKATWAQCDACKSMAPTSSMVEWLASAGQWPAQFMHRACLGTERARQLRVAADLSPRDKARRRRNPFPIAFAPTVLTSVLGGAAYDVAGRPLGRKVKEAIVGVEELPAEIRRRGGRRRNPLDDDIQRLRREDEWPFNRLRVALERAGMFRALAAQHDGQPMTSEERAVPYKEIRLCQVRAGDIIVDVPFQSYDYRTDRMTKTVVAMDAMPSRNSPGCVWAKAYASGMVGIVGSLDKSVRLVPQGAALIPPPPPPKPKRQVSAQVQFLRTKGLTMKAAQSLDAETKARLSAEFVEWAKGRKANPRRRNFDPATALVEGLAAGVGVGLAREGWRKWGGRRSNPALRLSNKDPRTMTPAQVNHELDKLSILSSRVNDAMIAAGRGSWKWEEVSNAARQGDPLSLDAVAINARERELHIEIEARQGPSMRSRMLPGMKRRANPLTRREAEQAMKNARSVGKIRDGWHIGNAVGRYAMVSDYASDLRYR